MLSTFESQELRFEERTEISQIAARGNLQDGERCLRKHGSANIWARRVSADNYCCGPRQFFLAR